MIQGANWVLAGTAFVGLSLFLCTKLMKPASVENIRKRSRRGGLYKSRGAKRAQQLESQRPGGTTRDDRISDRNRRREIEMDPKADKTALRIFNKRKVCGWWEQFTIAGVRGVARPELRNRIPGRVGLDALHALLRSLASPEAEEIQAFFRRIVSSVMQAGMRRREHRETKRTNDNNHQHLTWGAAAGIFGHREWALWEQETVHGRGAYEDTHERDPRLVRWYALSCAWNAYPGPSLYQSPHEASLYQLWICRPCRHLRPLGLLKPAIRREVQFRPRPPMAHAG
ncbi:hypothetical protein QAD02_007659 [Eretmocerus hayati]|uniref:Uncharacterized protein n=1 Tax=Eretmocerus hayati TaxID=131215 RepID=A0ACC2N6Q7_9HYME|nr:hypothetical protein QAD02_007659 [Eretmocerus hayati]